MRLNNRKIIITGASKGIGAASARLFAAEGASLVLTARNTADLESVADEVRRLGRTVGTICGDVTDPSDCEAIATFAKETLGAIDGLFNNAGGAIDSDAGTVGTPYETWRKIICTNLDSVFLMSKAVIPIMIDAGKGAIVNNASMVAHIGSATPQIAYCASKGGVLAMSREMAIELASQNIRVNTLSPGPIETQMHEVKIANDPDFWERRTPHLPMKRYGSAEEIASAACFLISNESSYMTGQAMIVDGGITSAFTT